MVLKGVNLGGWLVLERWITPFVFDGLQAWDETAFCRELGDKKFERLEKHRCDFITKEDFQWLAAKGLNCVRIPVPHWLFGGIEPYVECKHYLDKAFEWAEAEGLKVILDVHTAPGSQNGYKHSGEEGRVEWHKDPENIKQSLDFLEKLSQKYGRRHTLVGIELLNEPNSRIPRTILGKYYEESYQIVRKYCPEEVAVIISDSFKPLDFKEDLVGESYKNTILDSHLYQCFAGEDKKLNFEEHLQKTRYQWGGLVEEVQKTRPLIIGEWSLALPEKAFAGMDEKQKTEAVKSYGQAQMEVFSKTAGWFFWTYKTEHHLAWDFRCCTQTSLLPVQF